MVVLNRLDAPDLQTGTRLVAAMRMGLNKAWEEEGGRQRQLSEAAIPRVGSDDRSMPPLIRGKHPGFRGAPVHLGKVP